MYDLLLLWDVIGQISMISRVFISAYIFTRFTEPFFDEPKKARIAGLCYLGGGIFAYFCPWEMNNRTVNLICTLALFTGAVVTERKRIRQKLFLSVVIYLTPWIIHEAVVIPWNTIYDLIMFESYVLEDIRLSLIFFTVLELFYGALRCFLIYALTWVISKVYIYKKDELSTAELLIMLLPLLPALVGLLMTGFFESQLYRETSRYAWEIYPQYKWILLLYDAVCFGSVVASVYMSQRIKKARRSEKENAVLAGQIEEIKRHIGKLEELYSDVRNFRHDVGNHLATLEGLYKTDIAEAEKYSLKISGALEKFTFSVNSGDPVTDIVLDEKYRLAKEKNISTQSAFFFPEDSDIDVFDVSVILSNALDNAIENADGNELFIKVTSRREKNAYLIEVINSFSGKFTPDERGLPPTTKPDKLSHGFGLANIRRIAQSYHGDVSLEAKQGCAVLTVMLMTGVS